MPAEKNTAHYGIVVGINRYPGLEHDLQYARNDADEFYDWLISDDGGRLPKDNVRRVTIDDKVAKAFREPLASHPTFSEITGEMAALNKTVSKQVAEHPELFPETRLYVYFSGHGITPDWGAGALLMANCDPAANAFDHLELSKLARWYEQAGIFHELVVFADCCRDRRAMLLEMGPPWGLSVQGYGPCDWNIAYATESGTKSYEADADTMRGYFTRAVIDGLKGGAADRATGEITASSLMEYARTSVEWQLKLKRVRYKQVPKLSASDTLDPIVLRPKELGPMPRPVRRMRLRFPAGLTGTAGLLRDSQPTGVEIDLSLEEHELELEEDVYQLRVADSGPALKDDGIFRVIAKDQDVGF